MKLQAVSIIARDWQIAFRTIQYKFKQYGEDNDEAEV